MARVGSIRTASSPRTKRYLQRTTSCVTRTAGTPRRPIAQARAGSPQTAARRSADVAVRRKRRRIDAAIARPGGPGSTTSAGSAARRTKGSGTRIARRKGRAGRRPREGKGGA
jgi:hypothetical protein